MSELKKVKELRDLFEKKEGENNVILFKWNNEFQP